MQLVLSKSSLLPYGSVHMYSIMPPGKQSLSSLYDSLNVEFFVGRLPKYRVVFNSSMRLDGEIVPERRLIRLNRALASNRVMLRQTLLHEMCHNGCESHGKKLQERLIRLGDQGEDWAYAEAEQYRTAPSWNKMMSNLILEMIDITHSVGGTTDASYPSFSRVVESLAYEHGMSPRELMRRAPWRRASWERAKREAIESRKAEKAPGERLAPRNQRER